MKASRVEAVVNDERETQCLSIETLRTTLKAEVERFAIMAVWLSFSSHDTGQSNNPEQYCMIYDTLSKTEVTLYAHIPDEFLEYFELADDAPAEEPTDHKVETRLISEPWAGLQLQST